MSTQSEIEDYVLNRIAQEFPQLNLEDIGKLSHIVCNSYELKKDNIGRIDKYISEKIIMDSRKDFINTDLELYHQCCENNFDDEDSAMDEYIEKFKEKYGFDVWKSTGYFSSPDKFECGEYKEIFIWCG